MIDISYHSKFKLSPDVLSQVIDDETVLLDMKSEYYFGLDEVGTNVLEFLKEGADIESVVHGLMSLYDVEQDLLEKDITALFQELLDAGLIGPVT